MEKQYRYFKTNAKVINGSKISLWGYFKFTSKWSDVITIDLLNKDLVEDLIKYKIIEEIVTPVEKNKESEQELIKSKQEKDVNNLYTILDTIIQKYNKSELLSTQHDYELKIIHHTNKSNLHSIKINLFHYCMGLSITTLANATFVNHDIESESGAVTKLILWANQIEQVTAQLKDIIQSYKTEMRNNTHFGDNSKSLLESYKVIYESKETYEKRFGLLRYALMQEAIKADARYKQNIRTVAIVYIFDFNTWKISELSKEKTSTLSNLNYAIVPAFRTKEELIDAIKVLRPLFHEFKPVKGGK